jgi:predicted nucleic acid-binding protein
MDPRLREWWADNRESQLWLSVLVLGELRRGVELLRRRDDTAAQALDSWLFGLVEEFGDRLLAVDERVAEMWGRLGVPDAVPVVDGLLAATALVHDLTLVTRNVADVEGTGVRVLNPFSPAS